MAWCTSWWAITWTSATQVLWCCKASPGASEFMQNKGNSTVTTIMLHHLDSLCHFDGWYLFVSSYLFVALWRHMATEIWVNIGSGNGVLPDGTKPLPEPMLTDLQWSPVTFILGQFHKWCLNHQSLKSVWKLHIENVIQISQGPKSYHKMFYGGADRIQNEWTIGKPLNSTKTLRSLFTDDNSACQDTTQPPPTPTPTSALTRASSSLSWLTSCMSCSMIRSRSSGCGGDGMPFWPNGSPNKSWKTKQQ